MNGQDVSISIRQPNQVFASIAAQPDNLGDIEIRKTLLGWMIELPATLNIYVADMPDSYVRAFDVSGAMIYRSAFVFQLALWRSLLSRSRTVLVFSPGPQVLSSSLMTLLKSAINLANVALVRLAHGRVVAIGRAFRGRSLINALLERALVRLSNLFVVRDEVSGSYLGLTLRTEPDLGLYGEVPSTDVERDTVSFSMRSDQPISMDALAVLVEAVRNAGLRPCFVTQVRRDEELHSRVAKDLGTEVISWDDESHSEQLRRVKAAYGRSVLVVTNRLHGAVFGIRAGATPVIVVDGGSSKIETTLGGFYRTQKLDTTTLSSADVDRLLKSAVTLDRAPHLTRESSAVAVRLGQLRSDVQTLFRPAGANVGLQECD